MPVLTKKQLKIKKKFKKKWFFPFIFSFLLLFVLLILNFSEFFSSTIIHKGSLFFGSKLETTSYSIYGVSIKDFDNLSDANIFGEYVKEKGGAGFVYESGEHFVLANGYQTLNEAQEIKTNLIKLGYNARIVNIKVDALSKNYKGKNQKKLTNALNFFRKAYDNLYEEDLNFDKKILDRKAINTSLAKNITNISAIISDLNAIKEKADLPLKEAILVPLNNTKQILDDLLKCNFEDTYFSSQLKSACILIVLQNKVLIKTLNEN